MPLSCASSSSPPPACARRLRHRARRRPRRRTRDAAAGAAHGRLGLRPVPGRPGRDRRRRQPRGGRLLRPGPGGRSAARPRSATGPSPPRCWPATSSSAARSRPRSTRPTTSSSSLVHAQPRASSCMATNRPAEAYASCPARVGRPGATPARPPCWRPGPPAPPGKWDAALARPDSKDRIFKLFARARPGAAVRARRAATTRPRPPSRPRWPTRPAGRSSRPAFGGLPGAARPRPRRPSALYDELLSRLSRGRRPCWPSRPRRGRAARPPPHADLPRRRGPGAAGAGRGPDVASARPRSALVYLRLSLRLDPKREEAWLMLGDLLSQTGDKAGARAGLRQASRRPRRATSAPGRASPGPTRTTTSPGR